MKEARTKVRWFASLVLTAALLTTALSTAYALWRELRVTPESRKTMGREFVVTATEKDGLTEFEIIVKYLKEKDTQPLSPYMNASLSVIEGGRWVAKTPLAEERAKDRISFRFRVSAAAAAESRFDLDEGNQVVFRNANGSPQRDKAGKPRIEQMMGGTAYWLWLRDFTEKKAGLRAE